MRRLVLVAALAASGGCTYVDASITYYPRVSAGSRVDGSGFGFGLNFFGFGASYKGVHAAFSRGYEFAFAKYRDATGPGTIGFVAPWNARVGVKAKRMGQSMWWTDITAGGSWGKGAGNVNYDMDIPGEDEDADGVRAAMWSVFLGPSLHYDWGQYGDFFITFAPVVTRATSDAYDPFTAYGVTMRIAIQSGLVAPPSEGKGGFFTLWRSGYDAEDMDRRMKQSQQDAERRQNEQRQQEKERQEREKRDKERACQSDPNC